MRIAYIISEDISTPSGVLKKVEAKIKYWKQYGHEVTVISLKSNSMISLIDDGVVLSQYVKEKNLKKKFLRRFSVSRKLDKYLKGLKPDIIYTRYISGSPDLVSVLKKYAPYIVEINTNDVEEFKNGKLRRYILNLLIRNYFFGNAKGFVSVSKELMSNKIFTKFHKKFVVIGNGYDFNNVKNKKLFFNDNPKFIFIGSPKQAWHGTDKIVKLANSLKNYEFHIVGPEKTDLLSNEKIGDNIVFHGYCNTEYLEKLIPQCDIGISTLALHRNNMLEASPLKSREYLAYGLPIVLGYDDSDLPQNFKYSLNIGNYENNVVDNIDNIKVFANSFRKVKPIEVIESSKKYLDYQEKERIRLEFIQKILKKDEKG
jgi:glycosyltransferase involved in cell wall biosynthesis